MTVILNVFASDHVKEHWIDEGEDIRILTVQAFGREFKAAYPVMLDIPDTITVDHDGEVFATSCGQIPVADNGAWYCGDESIQIGKIDLEFPGDWETMCAYIDRDDSGVFVVGEFPDDYTPTLGD